MSDPTGDYSAVLELVDLRRWGMRARIFALVARLSADAPELGAYIGQRDVAAAVTTDRRYVHKLLRYMARERILVEAEPSAGRRPSRWRINPNLRAWRGVPWLVTPEHAAYVVAAATPPPRAPIRPVVARSYSAPQNGVVARSYGAPQVFRSGAPWNAPQDFRSGAPRERATNENGPARDTSSLESASHSARDSSSRSDVQEVIDAIHARCGHDVFGRLVDRVAVLVDQHGPGPLIAETAGIDPTGMRGVAFVEALERQMRRRAQGGEVRRHELEQRMVGLDKMIATYEAEDIPADDLLAERAALAVQLGTAPPATGSPGEPWPAPRQRPPDLYEEKPFLDVDPDELRARLAAAGHSRTVVRNLLWWLEGKGYGEMRCNDDSQRKYRQILVELGDI